MSRLKIVLYANCIVGDRVSQSHSYVGYLSQFGEVILITADNDLNFWLAQADVLVLPGGSDVDPRRYGEAPQIFTGPTNTHYEYLDEKFLIPWIATGKPIIGICRGMQSLNVAMGGSLFQDIDGHVGASEIRSKPAHPIYTDIDGDEDYRIHKVNSFHHQAVKEIAEGFEVIGWGPVYQHCPSLRKYQKHLLLTKYKWIEITKKDGGSFIRHEKNGSGETLYYMSIAEIIKHRTRPYVAFQYHPEDFNCPLATKLITETLSAAYPNAFVDTTAELTTIK